MKLQTVKNLVSFPSCAKLPVLARKNVTFTLRQIRTDSYTFDVCEIHAQRNKVVAHWFYTVRHSASSRFCSKQLTEFCGNKIVYRAPQAFWLRAIELLQRQNHGFRTTSAGLVGECGGILFVLRLMYSGASCCRTKLFGVHPEYRGFSFAKFTRA